jgi:DNA-binding response OmpR family regulator
MCLEQVLAEAGFAVRCEYKAQPAIDTVPEPDPEAAIIDLELPDMSGNRVVRELRARWPACRSMCVLASARSQMDDQGGDGGGRKPVDAHRLVRQSQEPHT